MSKTTHIAIGLGVAAIIAVLGFMAGGRQTVAPVATIEPKAGATPGDQLPNCVSFGGIRECIVRGVWTATPTTTPCTIPPPTVGTSTIQDIWLNVTTATSSAGTFTFATSTVPNATSSLIANLTLAAGAQGTLHWRGGTNNALQGPLNYINIGVSGVSQGGYTLGGSCYAKTRAVI